MVLVDTEAARNGREKDEGMTSLAPQKIGPHDWYYEYPTHLLLVHEVKTRDGIHVKTDTVKIYWRKIEASLKRVRARKPAKR